MNDEYLEHYGVLGMKWGVRRTPEELGHRVLKKAKTSNLDKWGKDENHNVLYITGYSGSGKSTLANSLKTKNTDVIHLDVYFEEVSKGAGPRSKSFDQYLKANNIKSPREIPRNRWEKEKTLTKFETAVKDYGKEMYQKNRRVIAEGIQIADEGLNLRPYYRGQPVVIAGTSGLISFRRRLTRDNARITSMNQARQYISWYSQMGQNLDDLTRITNAKRGEDWVREYLRKERRL